MSNDLEISAILDQAASTAEELQTRVVTLERELAEMEKRTAGVGSAAEAMALIEFVRNACADICNDVSSTHFADNLAWEQQDVDPLEKAESHGAYLAADECKREVALLDCYALLQKYGGKRHE
jgi:hypothetical protein